MARNEVDPTMASGASPGYRSETSSKRGVKLKTLGNLETVKVKEMAIGWGLMIPGHDRTRSNLSSKYCPFAITCSSSIHTSQRRVSTSTCVRDFQSAFVWLP